MAKLILRPVFKQQELVTMTEKFKDKIIEKIILILIRGGEFFVTHARLNGSYQNQTGNLRSSVGYIVLFNGLPVKMSNFDSIAVSPHVNFVSFIMKEGRFEGKKYVRRAKHIGGDGKEGSEEGQKLALELAEKFPTGLVLIGLVGMYYGKYVEAMGYDVITGAAIATEAFIKRDINAIMNKLK